MSKNLKVLAECIDARSGKRFMPGDTFDPAPTVAQAKRLVSAGCLPEEAVAEAKDVEDDGGVDAAAISRDQLNNDGLFDLSDEELAALATSEGVDLGDQTEKPGVIAAIRAHRAGGATLDPDDVQMRTEEGERKARAADAEATSRPAVRKPGKAK